MEPVGWLDLPARRLRHDLDNAADAVSDAIAASAADALWVPAFEGGHQDHDVANALAADWRIGCQSGNSPPIISPAAGSVPTSLRRGAAARSRSLRRRARRHGSDRRSPAYASERGNLRHVGLAQETCRPLPAHDYGAPPHPGRLFRERFHWVPFRHPRVDFAPSCEIYRDIGGWASARQTHRMAPLGQPPGGEARQADRELAGALDET